MPPTDNLAPRDVEALAAELVAYHAHFAPLFARAEQRQQAAHYLAGQLLDLERKSIEPMALAVPDGNVQALQHRPGGTRRRRGLGRRGRPPAAPGAGGRDAGRRRDGRARRGRLRLPQAGARVGRRRAPPPRGHPASARGYTLVDRRLYLPEQWFGEDYRARRRRCGVPTATAFQTRPTLAGDMIAALHRRGDLPFRWVTGDEHFGVNTPFLDRVVGLGLHYFAEVPKDTRAWLRRPRTAVPPAKPHGRPPRKARVAPGEPAPVRVDQFATRIPAAEWRAWTVKAGAKGPLVAEFAFRRAVAVRDGLPGPDVWVVLRRRPGDPGGAKVSLSSAPADTTQETLVWLSGMRWPVESAIQEAKGEVGRDHDEVRGWPGHPRAGRAPPHRHDPPGPPLPRAAPLPVGGKRRPPAPCRRPACCSRPRCRVGRVMRRRSWPCSPTSKARTTPRIGHTGVGDSAASTLREVTL